MDRLSGLMDFHDEIVAAFFQNRTARQNDRVTPLWMAIASNHHNNIMLWAEEDLARRRLVSSDQIAANKRAIDGFNQARNDAIEKIDDILSAEFVECVGVGRLNSETPGSMIDRISISSLKFFHMNLQVLRVDVDDQHRVNCATKAERIAQQRQDLMMCLLALLSECSEGKSYFKTYSQFKMYNDPSLNMVLVQELQELNSTKRQ